MSGTTFEAISDAITMKAVTDEARRHGACSLLRDGMTLPELAALLRSPQGLEWATAQDWPTAAVLANIPYADLMANRIYPDFAGEADGRGHDWVFTGHGTKATVRIHGTEALHHIAALDGARVRVEASGHAVATVYSSATASVEIVNTDHTAIISCHR